MKVYDIAVIGAGPGGYVAAIKAAQKGASVCLIEKESVGGTCLNRGCIPTKALFSTARMLDQLRRAGDHGIEIGSQGFDFSQAMARKDQVVGKLVGGVVQLLKGNGVDLYTGHASLAGEGRVRVRNGGVVANLQTRAVIIATGSLPVTPKSLAVDERNILTSTGILAIKELPRRLLVIGGGYIGCEFAGIFAACGSQVTVVESLPRILLHSDRQMAREVEKGFRGRGVELLTGTTVEGLELQPESVVARFSTGSSLEVDKVLVAIGRRPNSAGLGLEECGVVLDRNGAVLVDEQLRTNIEGLFAIGDVTGGIQLAHVASYQAEIAVANALGDNLSVNYTVVPSSIFTEPEVSQVGLTEEQCKEQGLAYKVGRFAYQASSKALCDGETAGQVKLLAAEDGRLLGAHIAGEEASALIAEAALALATGMTATELADVIHSHPTLPEMLKEAAEDVLGLAVHKVGRKMR